MNKSEFAEVLRDQFSAVVDLTKGQSEEIVDQFGLLLAALVKKEDKIVLPHFGAFKMREVEGKIGRNPRTGEPVPIRPKTAVKFQISGPLAEALKK